MIPAPVSPALASHRRRRVVPATLGALAVLSAIYLLWPEHHDLRRMTYEQVAPVMWEQRGKTAADLIRMFGEPSHRGVRGIFDGTVVFRWDADGGTVAVEFRDEAPADRSTVTESLEDRMRREDTPDAVRLRQLRCIGWEWERN